jgi:hypothetical protein
MAQIESISQAPISIDEVYSFLNLCESHRKFIPRMIELQQTSSGNFGQVGTRLSGMLRYFGIRIPVQYEIVKVEPNRQLAMKGQMGPVSFKDGYILKKNEDGTEIRFWLELIPSGWTKVFSPFMGLIGRIHAFETLRNLKRELAAKAISSQRS